MIKEYLRQAEFHREKACNAERSAKKRHEDATVSLIRALEEEQEARAHEELATAAEAMAQMYQHHAMLASGVPEDDEDRLKLEGVIRSRVGHFASTPADRLARDLVAQEFPAGDIREITPEKRAQLQELYSAAVKQAKKES